VDPLYDVYLNGYNVFVKDQKGKNNFVGDCWPGLSVWLDFFNPEGIQYWKSLYAYENFTGTSPNCHFWVDMNEPSLFSGPELTLPKEATHYFNYSYRVPHREVHNAYAYAS